MLAWKSAAILKDGQGSLCSGYLWKQGQRQHDQQQQQEHTTSGSYVFVIYGNQVQLPARPAIAIETYRHWSLFSYDL